MHSVVMDNIEEFLAGTLEPAQTPGGGLTMVRR